MSKRVSGLGVLAVVLVACGGHASGYPRDSSLRLDQLQSLGTHNSYHLRPPPGPRLIPPRDYSEAPIGDQLAREGVRQLELDVHLGADGRLHVFHIGADDGTTCPLFADCLRAIRSWSEAHPRHQPLFLLIQPRTDTGGAFDDSRVDREILAVFDRRQLITPDDVQRDRPTLAQAVERDGWPTLAKARGRMMVVLNAGPEERSAYTRNETSLRGRVMFVYSDLGSPLAAFMSVPNPIFGGAEIHQLVAAGYIVRTRADEDGVEARAGDRRRLDAALASGAQLVSTDFPTPAPSGYLAAIPGGTPSRCNPVSAPRACRPTDIENPAALD